MNDACDDLTWLALVCGKNAVLRIHCIYSLENLFTNPAFVNPYLIQNRSQSYIEKLLLVATVTFVSYIQTPFPRSQTWDRTSWNEYDSLLSNPAPPLLRSPRIYLPLSRLREKKKKNRWIDGSATLGGVMSGFCIMHK